MSVNYTQQSQTVTVKQTVATKSVKQTTVIGQTQSLTTTKKSTTLKPDDVKDIEVICFMQAIEIKRLQVQLEEALFQIEETERVEIDRNYYNKHIYEQDLKLKIVVEKLDILLEEKRQLELRNHELEFKFYQPLKVEYGILLAKYKDLEIEHEQWRIIMDRCAIIDAENQNDLQLQKNKFAELQEENKQLKKQITELQAGFDLQMEQFVKIRATLEKDIVDQKSHYQGIENKEEGQIHNLEDEIARLKGLVGQLQIDQASYEEQYADRLSQEAMINQQKESQVQVSYEEPQMEVIQEDNYEQYIVVILKQEEEISNIKKIKQLEQHQKQIQLDLQQYNELSMLKAQDLKMYELKIIELKKKIEDTQVLQNEIDRLKTIIYSKDTDIQKNTLMYCFINYKLQIRQQTITSRLTKSQRNDTILQDENDQLKADLEILYFDSETKRIERDEFKRLYEEIQIQFQKLESENLKLTSSLSKKKAKAAINLRFKEDNKQLQFNYFLISLRLLTIDELNIKIGEMESVIQILNSGGASQTITVTDDNKLRIFDLESKLIYKDNIINEMNLRLSQYQFENQQFFIKIFHRRFKLHEDSNINISELKRLIDEKEQRISAYKLQIETLTYDCQRVQQTSAQQEAFYKQQYEKLREENQRYSLQLQEVSSSQIRQTETLKQEISRQTVFSDQTNYKALYERTKEELAKVQRTQNHSAMYDELYKLYTDNLCKFILISAEVSGLRNGLKSEVQSPAQKSSALVQSSSRQVVSGIQSGGEIQRTSTVVQSSSYTQVLSPEQTQGTRTVVQTSSGYTQGGVRSPEQTQGTTRTVVQSSSVYTQGSGPQIDTKKYQQ